MEGAFLQIFEKPLLPLPPFLLPPQPSSLPTPSLPPSTTSKLKAPRIEEDTVDEEVALGADYEGYKAVAAGIVEVDEGGGVRDVDGEYWFIGHKIHIKI